MTKQFFDSILYGGDYNPEQWPEEIWDEDIRIFNNAKSNTASINVCSWASLQPSENKFDFAKLDGIVKHLEDNDYNTIMGTSTAALRSWMCRKYPDVTRVDFEGCKHRFGYRNNHCPNSPSFQKVAKKL